MAFGAIQAQYATQSNYMISNTDSASVWLNDQNIPLIPLVYRTLIDGTDDGILTLIHLETSEELSAEQNIFNALIVCIVENFDANGNVSKSKIDNIRCVEVRKSEKDSIVNAHTLAFFYYSEFSKKLGLSKKDNLTFETKLIALSKNYDMKYSTTVCPDIPFPKFRPMKPISLKSVKFAEYQYRKFSDADTANSALFLPDYPEYGFVNLPTFLLELVEDEKVISYSDRNIQTRFIKQEPTDRPPIRIDTSDTNSNDYPIQIIKKKKDFRGFHSFIVKELWLYDADSLVLDKRLVAIAPVKEYYRDDDIEQKNLKSHLSCWIKFSDIQELSAHQYVYQKNKFSPLRTFYTVLSNLDYVCISGFKQYPNEPLKLKDIPLF